MHGYLQNHLTDHELLGKIRNRLHRWYFIANSLRKRSKRICMQHFLHFGKTCIICTLMDTRIIIIAASILGTVTVFINCWYLLEHVYVDYLLSTSIVVFSSNPLLLLCRWHSQSNMYHSYTSWQMCVPSLEVSLFLLFLLQHELNGFLYSFSSYDPRTVSFWVVVFS